MPPSSSVTRLIGSDASRMISPPVFVEPVNATLSTPGWRTRYEPVVGPSPGTMLIDTRGEANFGGELGDPQDLSGVCGSGLSTTVQPAASAGASFHVDMRSG